MRMRKLFKSGVLLLAISALSGCKHSTTASANVANDAAPAAVPSDPPTVNVGLDVEQAYAAIPHRRTVWQQTASTVPAEDATYLQNIFQVIDQAIALRVVGVQDFSNGNFNSVDVDASFDQLITYARAMHVPADLAQYHQQILTALKANGSFLQDGVRAGRLTWRSNCRTIQARSRPRQHLAPPTTSSCGSIRTRMRTTRTLSSTTIAPSISCEVVPVNSSRTRGKLLSLIVSVRLLYLPAARSSP
jgi:hypothetical protein